MFEATKFTLLTKNKEEEEEQVYTPQIRIERVEWVEPPMPTPQQQQQQQTSRIQLQADKSLVTQPHNNSNKSKTDIVPSLYEGGHRIWECSVDLCRYIEPGVFAGKTVLDLGCGHGLTGTYALVYGHAKRVIFQDLNRQVLVESTMPTVALNNGDPQKCTFIAGDWAFLDELVVAIDDQQVDIILTSDTIYSLATLPHLVNVLARFPRAEVYVGAKRYYFGVGGSTMAFQRQCQSTLGRAPQSVKVIEDGTSNLREILYLSSSCD